MTKKKKCTCGQKYITLGAIAGIVIIECAALSMGYNGQLQILVVGAICALAGVATEKPKILK